MLKIFDFRCANGHVFEDLVDSTCKVSRCGCGADATRIISPIKCQLDGASGDFPGEHMKWVREHEKAGRKSGNP